MNYRELIKPTLINFPIGLLLGIIFSIIHYKLVEISIKNAINNHKALLLSILLNVLKLIALATPLGFSVIFPKVINIFGVYVGVMVPKLYLFVRSIKKVKNRR